MAAGKSTLLLQMDFNLRGCGRTGIRLTKLGREGAATITSRLGLSVDATEIDDTTDLFQLASGALAAGVPVSYILADEVQFYTPDQVDQLARVVDELGVPVSMFGIATDFTCRLFPGSQRAFEVADEHLPLTVQVDVRCWCGEPARMNARVVDGVMVTEGERVVVGDTSDAQVHYVLLCRPHYRLRVLPPPLARSAASRPRRPAAPAARSPRA
jgi:thymidine kinase